MLTDVEPLPFTPDTLDVYLRRPSGIGSGVYMAVLLTLAAALAALPLVKVPVSVRAAGILRPAADAHSITAPVGGEVVRGRLREPRDVQPGDTLVLLASSSVQARADALRERRATLELEERDLVQLIAGIWRTDPSIPRGIRYGDELRALQTEIAALSVSEAAVVREAERASALHTRGLASEAEVSSFRDRVEQLRSEIAIVRTRTGLRWRVELASVRESLTSLRREAAILEAEARQLAVVSPVGGRIEEMAPLAPGSFVSAGQLIATISPESPVVAELYLSSRDVGAIEPRSEVRLQLDAYRFSEWGSLGGTVIDVSHELVRVDGLALGKVRVMPSGAWLPGPSGGIELRPGGTVSARIPVARRSLWSLLRERRVRSAAEDAIASSGGPAG